MCPGCLAVMALTSRFVSPFGSMNLPPIQAQLGEQSGDDAPADRDPVGAQLEGDARCWPLLLAPQLFDPRHRLSGWRGQLPGGSRRAVKQPDFAELLVAVHPLRGGRAGDSHLGCDVPDGPGPGAFDKSLAAFGCEWRVAVRHWSVSSRWWDERLDRSNASGAIASVVVAAAMKGRAVSEAPAATRLPTAAPSPAASLPATATA